MALKEWVNDLKKVMIGKNEVMINTFNRTIVFIKPKYNKRRKNNVTKRREL